MFSTIQKMSTRDEKGFTLVELLIVIAIIAILAAIAIPQFAAYRVRGIKASMQADARNIATMEEATFGDTQSYSAANGGTTAGSAFTIGVAPTAQIGKLSQGNVLSIGGAPTAYQITITNGAASGVGGYVQANDGTATFF